MRGLTGGPTNSHLVVVPEPARERQDQGSGVDTPIEEGPRVGCVEAFERNVTSFVQPPTLFLSIQPESNLKRSDKSDLVFREEAQVRKQGLDVHRGLGGSERIG